MKTFKQLQKEYNQGLIDLDDLFLEWGSYEIKAVKFVRHIERHLKLFGMEMNPKQKIHASVICKICNKTIDEIDKEEYL